MLIPNNSNKKYIQMVIGVFISFTIISPIISSFSNMDNLKESITNYEEYLKTEETYSNLSFDLEEQNNEDVKNIYKTTLENDLKSRLENKGYTVSDAQIDINLEEKKFGQINSIKLTVVENEGNENIAESNSNVQTIKAVQIDKVNLNNSEKTNDEDSKKDKSLSQDKINEIKEYISLQYEVNKKNIIIN